MKEIIEQMDNISPNKTPIMQYIESLFKTHNQNFSLSIRKITELVNNHFNINLSKTTIHRIMRNKLHYKYVKTSIKNNKLNSLSYKLMTSYYLKIFIRSLIFGFNPIFIDESSIYSKNNNYYTWRLKEEMIYSDSNISSKTNLLLAVSSTQVVHFEFLSGTVTGDKFCNFISSLYKSILNKGMPNPVFILDNASIHKTTDVLVLLNKYKIKTLFTVPYFSQLNMIELVFRFIKNIIYKKMYTTMNDVIKDVISILNSEHLHNTMELLYKETLLKYLSYVEEISKINLNR